MDDGDEDDGGGIAADSGPGRAMRVAHALRAREGEDFAKPGNLVEVRFVKGQSLSLTASRLLALMILAAGGDAWRPVAHKMRKADIRRGHKGNERISDMLEELHRTLFAIDDLSWRGKKATKRFPLIQSSREEVEEDGGERGWIEWEFTPDARRLIKESETYAVLNRQAVLGFRSTYALRLYEMGALRIHRRQSTWRGDMTALRAAFGIAPELYKDFAQLRRKVLERAKAEIDQLAHFTVSWREIRRGRAVVEIEFVFQPKDAPEQLAATAENERHSAGRRARREDMVERVVAPPPVKRLAAPPYAALSQAAVSGAPSPAPSTFPEGSVRWSKTFAQIAQAHGGGWDIDLIAAAYREQMGDRLAKLSGAKLTRSWTGFCQAFAARRGRP
ncbi:RepB family plasmid replication initiator protein [Phenylobacterium sp.]|uniref:RepB family plasmid replication initiator protein n=1 Tax=Phenylobacterium sp. TaxID=1871053 RepID=UPI0035B1F762